MMSVPALLPPDEKEVQRAVIRLFSLAGFKVRGTSQYRASRVAGGLPDLMAHHHREAVALWFETKAPQRKGYDPLRRETWIPKPLSPEQVVFRADALRCRQRHYWGGLREAEAALVELGLAAPTGNGGIMLLRPV